MFVQDVFFPGISCASCYWCFDPGLSHFDCLRQMDSVSQDPSSVVCPLWLEDSSQALSLSAVCIQDPPKAGELASA